MTWVLGAAALMVAWWAGCWWLDRDMARLMEELEAIDAESNRRQGSVAGDVDILPGGHGGGAVR